MATKFTYKMRSGGNGMWGRGPAQCKNNKYGLDPVPDLDTGIGAETAINHYGLTTLFKLSADGELFIP